MATTMQHTRKLARALASGKRTLAKAEAVNTAARVLEWDKKNPKAALEAYADALTRQPTVVRGGKLVVANAAERAQIVSAVRSVIRGR